MVLPVLLFWPLTDWPDLKSRDEFGSTERRLGARELERGDDEANEGITDRGEVVLRFLIGTLSFLKRVNCTSPRSEFHSGESLSVRFEVGVDSFAFVSCCSCSTTSLGCDAALLFFLVSGDCSTFVCLQQTITKKHWTRIISGLISVKPSLLDAQTQPSCQRSFLCFEPSSLVLGVCLQSRAIQGTSSALLFGLG